LRVFIPAGMDRARQRGVGRKEAHPLGRNDLGQSAVLPFIADASASPLRVVVHLAPSHCVIDQDMSETLHCAGAHASAPASVRGAKAHSARGVFHVPRTHDAAHGAGTVGGAGRIDISQRYASRKGRAGVRAAAPRPA